MKFKENIMVKGKKGFDLVTEKDKAKVFYKGDLTVIIPKESFEKEKIQAMLKELGICSQDLFVIVGLKLN